MKIRPRRTNITFGTEGWRAVIADEYTVENVRRITQAVAAYWGEEVDTPARQRPRVGVGFDTRFGSERMAHLVAEIFAANGFSVLLAERTSPTPAISALVRRERLVGAVMITASHNPPHFNGYKVKASDGGSIESHAIQRIEALLDKRPVQQMPLADALHDKRVRVIDPIPGYLKGIQEFVDLPLIRRAPLRVVVDAMHGTGNGLLGQMLQGGKPRVTTLHADPDPLFGGHAPEPIPRYLPELLALTKKQRAHIGLATDGDSDRIGGARPDGKFLNPGQILCLILLHLLKERKMTGGVVTTISNIAWIPQIAEEYGLLLYETPVGFKHVAKVMREDHVLIGGEESGGIGITQYMPERDGVLLGLLLLEVLATRRTPLLTMLRQMERKYGRFEYGRVDLHVPASMRSTVMRRLSSKPPRRMAGQPIVSIQTHDGLKLKGKHREWVLFRLSGTEPILRIYAEAPTQRATQRLLDWGKTLAKP